MDTVHKEVRFWGLGHHLNIIEGIIEELALEQYAFDIRLILMEAVTNAYYHGNLSDCTKPITIRYMLDGDLLNLQIQDAGNGGHELVIPDRIGDDELLEDGGRGLYLIRCFSDSAELIHNTMFINKSVCTH
ncbi:hypothetical protein R70723_20605 [Paenibacillus sp. FSL R7-0273]|uniref:ATP-binding protein n=1 Tax=Paenibacillus sp. FSL R7-0273 TaxID=1536772 RepID=UPI0004F8A1AB|nr:ATP-binding protein [Paenibacillus sp. FSL R7-0273]AIQ48037.1 hypothetical protein R70723_20605 [Paenibacillus sp. FSL R7-0273]OMF84696.1 hypothetical protein BK144_29450 [Paenibacillus sp. FSL R7-0273]